MSNPTIITSDLENTFRALRNQDPARMREMNVPQSRGYTPIPNQNFALTTSVSGAFNRYASAAGNGGTIYGQPQFFSPVHTPINWQIPSKRLEIYQWLIVDGQLLLDDFTYSSIKEFVVDGDITEDVLTNGIMWENPKTQSIISGSGTLRNPVKWSQRNCEDKECFEFRALGYHRAFTVSEEHGIYVLDGKSWRKRRKIKKDIAYKIKKGVAVEKRDFNDKIIVKKDAKDVSLDDYLITPIQRFKQEPSVGEDMAYLLGLCVADGCIKNPNIITITSSINDKHIDNLESIVENVTGGLCSYSKKIHDRSENAFRSTISKNKIGEKFSVYIVGKHTKKKFTKEIFNLSEKEILSVLGGYFDGDGSYNSEHNILVANKYS